MKEDCERCITNPCKTPFSKGASGAWVCGYYTPPNPTDGDRIRAMSDEELAKYIESVQNRNYHRWSYWLDELRQEAT